VPGRDYEGNLCLFVASGIFISSGSGASRVVGCAEESWTKDWGLAGSKPGHLAVRLAAGVSIVVDYPLTIVGECGLKFHLLAGHQIQSPGYGRHLVHFALVQIRLVPRMIQPGIFVRDFRSRGGGQRAFGRGQLMADTKGGGRNTCYLF